MSPNSKKFSPLHNLPLKNTFYCLYKNMTFGSESPWSRGEDSSPVYLTPNAFHSLTYMLLSFKMLQ